jgi:hypothetical protein
LLAGWEGNDGMLSKEEERELIGRFQNDENDAAARYRLIRKFFYLIAQEVRKVKGPPRADLEMAGVLAFFDVVRTFDLSSNYRLSTPARKRLHGAMLNEVARWKGQGLHGDTRDHRWLVSNCWKYRDRQLIGGDYSAGYNETLIMALMAAMRCPNTGIKDYRREQAIQAIGDFEAGQVRHAEYNTLTEGGFDDPENWVDEDYGPALAEEREIPDEGRGGAGDNDGVFDYSHRPLDEYEPLNDAEWVEYCRQRATARYTDAHGAWHEFFLWNDVTDTTGRPEPAWSLLSPWDARARFPTHVSPLRQVDRQQYEAYQRAAHGAYAVATRFKLRKVRKPCMWNWVFAPLRVPPLDVLLQLAADAAERKCHVEIDEASGQGCDRPEPV